MREIKFRAWDIKNGKFLDRNLIYPTISLSGSVMAFNGEERLDDTSHIVFMQYTGLKDKNGKEIYEFMELNDKYEVIYQAPCYVLRDISSGDIIKMLSNSNNYVITREYTKI